MAMARREFAAILRSIKRWLQLIVAALLIVMDSFDEASRALEQDPHRRPFTKKAPPSRTVRSFSNECNQTCA
jgi:hypothetical protein